MTTNTANNVIEILPAIVEPAMVPAYSTEKVVKFINGIDNAQKNFQRYIVGMIQDNQVDYMLDACEELALKYESKELNKKLSILRVQIARACEALELPKYTIKKVDGKYAFVLASKQAPAVDPDGQQEGQQDEQQDEQPEDTETLHTEAARLMAKFMQSRSIEDAAKVTEFMMGLVV